MNKKLERKKVLEMVDYIMKKYSITPDRMACNRSALKWIFLEDKK